MHTGTQVTSGVYTHTHTNVHTSIYSLCDYVRSCCGLLIDGLLAGRMVQGQRTQIEGSSLEIAATAATAAPVISSTQHTESESHR